MYIFPLGDGLGSGEILFTNNRDINLLNSIDEISHLRLNKFVKADAESAI